LSNTAPEDGAAAGAGGAYRGAREHHNTERRWKTNQRSAGVHINPFGFCVQVGPLCGAVEAIRLLDFCTAFCEPVPFNLEVLGYCFRVS